MNNALRLSVCLSAATLIGCGEGTPGPSTPGTSSATQKLVLNDSGVTYFINNDNVPFYEQINRKEWRSEINSLPPEDQKLYANSGTPIIFGASDQTQFPKIPPNAFGNIFNEPGDFPGQDGSLGKDRNDRFNLDGDAGFSFTKLDKFNGATKDVLDTEYGCVKDNNTQLVWEHKTNERAYVFDPLQPQIPPVINHHSAHGIFSWYDPNPNTNGGDPGQQNGGACPSSIVIGDTKQLIDLTNGEQLCGYNDWRLPTIEELRSLVNYQVKSGTLGSPAMADLRFFPYLAETEHRWSSQTVAKTGSRHRAFGFHFHEGQTQSHEKACQPKNGKVENFFNGVILVRSDND